MVTPLAALPPTTETKVGVSGVGQLLASLWLLCLVSLARDGLLLLFSRDNHFLSHLPLTSTPRASLRRSAPGVEVAVVVAVRRAVGSRSCTGVVGVVMLARVGAAVRASRCFGAAGGGVVEGVVMTRCGHAGGSLWLSL